MELVPSAIVPFSVPPKLPVPVMRDSKTLELAVTFAVLLFESRELMITSKAVLMNGAVPPFIETIESFIAGLTDMDCPVITISSILDEPAEPTIAPLTAVSVVIIHRIYTVSLFEQVEGSGTFVSLPDDQFAATVMAFPAKSFHVAE